ncbi:hypothetical protein PPERSA_00238 [Pseudocohnilembus persalinus]|uniref:Uncharacterized protein n=1 Tax=Pseudocohnilembus persalinus TaxID=266149 RepID=A0A0V0Q912_PSEPJ|nr:hypothetical protein PPERSA_00238 [Pseudocohnilembus persalinus]|eukprot:KRW98650.1 hypothetical protein PPERSA_00238 [Pseudocohnilembus persalinus]
MKQKQQQKQDHSKIENNAIFHYYKEQHQKDQDNLAVFNKSFTISPNEKNQYLQNPQYIASSPVGPPKKTQKSEEKKTSNNFIEQSKQNQQPQQNLKGKQNEYIQQNCLQTDQINNNKQQVNLKPIQPQDQNNNQNANLQINQEKQENNNKNKDNYYENIQQLPSINNQQNFNLKPKFSEQKEQQHDLNTDDIQNNQKDNINNINNEINFNTQQTYQKWTKFNPQQVFRPRKLEYTNFKVRSQSLGLELYLQTNNQYRELILTNH